jgi:hypothetical protein
MWDLHKGRGKVSYLQVPVKINATMEYRIVGPCDTKPTPAEGYTIGSEPIKMPNVNGKFWLEYKIILP